MQKNNVDTVIVLKISAILNIQLTITPKPVVFNVIKREMFNLKMYSKSNQMLLFNVPKM